MKRTALSTAIVSGLIVSLVLGVQFIQLAGANGYIINKTYNGSPVITIESPSNNELVASNTVVVSFTLTRASSNWVSELRTSCAVSGVKIIVDGEVYRSVDVNSELPVPFSFSLNLTDLQNGAHSLQLNAYCRGVSMLLVYPGIQNEQYTHYEALSDAVSFFKVKELSQFLLIMPSGNNEYSSSDVPLDFMSFNVSDFGYSLDGEEMVPIDGNTTLKGVSDGVHSIVLYGKNLNGSDFSSEPLSFGVDTGKPQITFLSIENNTTYHTQDLDLIFYLSESSPEMKYTLNGNDQIQTVVINGNTSLLNLPFGSYTLVFSAKDSVSNLVSFQTVYFRIENPFPVLLIGIFAVVIIIIASLLVYFKKRKHS
jgi:hypothetical protein